MEIIWHACVDCRVTVPEEKLQLSRCSHCFEKLKKKGYSPNGQSVN